MPAAIEAYFIKNSDFEDQALLPTAKQHRYSKRQQHLSRRSEFCKMSFVPGKYPNI